MVRAHPLGALLETRVFAPLSFALPLRVVGRVTAGQADRLAVDETQILVEFGMLQRKAEVPALRWIKIHAKRMRQSSFARRLQILAFVEQVDGIAQAPTLTNRPARFGAVRKKRIVLRGMAP